MLTTEQIHEAVRVLHSMGYTVSKDGTEYSPPEPPKTTVYFTGGPWDGQTYEAKRVVGPLFAVGHEVGNHYWFDSKSDPPTYHWDGTEWAVKDGSHEKGQTDDNT